MRKLLIAVGCLFLSACSIKPERPDIFVECWETWHNTVIYAGWTDGHGVGMGGRLVSTKAPFIEFKDKNGQQIVIELTNRICAVAATE